MKGKVLDFNFQSGRGIIVGEDGKRYGFKNSEWKSNDVHPAKDIEVDFVVQETTAKAIYTEFTAIAGDMYEDKMVEVFVNKPEKTVWYKTAFNDFKRNGSEKISWRWNWWGFFGGFLYLLYRKTYLPALVLFVVSMIGGLNPYIGLVIAFLAGGFSTYFVYKTYEEKKEQVERAVSTPQERIEMMRTMGGYNSWVVWVYIVVVTIAFVGIAAAVVIPALAMQGQY